MGTAAVGTTLFHTLNNAAGASRSALGHHGATGRKGDGGYGPLARRSDQNGDEVLALPDGFEYVTFSKIGDIMSDGTPVPVSHDGTVSVVFDTRRGRVVREFVSFAGSFTNCAGGIAFRDAGWITCEETVQGPNEGWAQKHGYSFLVRTTVDGPEKSPPIKGMGRCAHEAVATDPGSGFVYQTEDDGNDSGFYRFRPRDPRDLTRGGRLEMLAVKGEPARQMITGQAAGEPLRVEWVRIDDPDPDLEGGATPVALQGIANGGALFNRLEGIWYDERSRGFFFTSTSGGNAARGQVWHYDTRWDRLTLFFESPGGSVLDSPDNLLMTPRGGILLCEDDASGADDDTHLLTPGIVDVYRLIGLDRTGEAFEFAVNVLSDSEFAGATFSPDGEVLFVNIQGNGDPVPGSGMTCAITGSWHRGAL